MPEQHHIDLKDFEQLEDFPLSEKPSQWGYILTKFRANKFARWSIKFIGTILAIALLADFIANEKPLISKINGNIYFPVVKEYAVSLGLAEWPLELQNIDWLSTQFTWAIRPMVPYSPSNMDQGNMQSKSPFERQSTQTLRWRHWLGTDELGRDILSGLIHGTRIAIMVGLTSMFIASIIGIVLGALAGFFGDHGLKVLRIRIWLNVPFLFMAWFYGVETRKHALLDATQASATSFFGQLCITLLVMTIIIAIPNWITHKLKQHQMFKKEISLPLDLIIMRVVDIILSIPTLFLLLAVIAIAKPSLWLVILIIGFTAWTGIARLVRSELLKVRSLNYIEAAKAMGLSQMQILKKHALPNALSSALVAIAFGIAASVLAEAFLSFLGIGLPADVVTWGSMLSESRHSPSAWWLAVFPGLAIFLTVTAYNLIGEGLSDAMDSKHYS